jgi:NADPH:quinone reductase
MLQTAYGSLAVRLDVQPCQSLLIRSGISSVDIAVAVLTNNRSLTVLSTNPARARRRVHGDWRRPVVLDDGQIAPKVREIARSGVEVALELVGTPTFLIL